MSAAIIFSREPHDAPPSALANTQEHKPAPPWAPMTNPSRASTRGENLPCLTPPPRNPTTFLRRNITTDLDNPLTTTNSRPYEARDDQIELILGDCQNVE